MSYTTEALLLADDDSDPYDGYCEADYEAWRPDEAYLPYEPDTSPLF